MYHYELAWLRKFAEDNRAPGHPLRPVRHPRHIVYRPKPNLGPGGPYRHMMLLPPYAFEVYRGRFLLGTVVRMQQGEWFAWTAEKGPGMGSFRKRSHAARALLDRMNAGYQCTSMGGLCSLLPNDMWADRPDRRGPHWCNIARLGGEHQCLCVCGIYLDLDRRRRDERA